MSDETMSAIKIGKHLSKEQSIVINSIVVNNYLNFPEEQILPVTHKMRINLPHDVPGFSKPRRLSFAERDKVKEIVKDLLKKNIIRPSNSPYASALVLVRKKNGEIRKCVEMIAGVSL